MKVRTIPVLVSGTILFIAFGLAWAAAREPVSGCGDAIATGPNTFAGTATLTIGGGDPLTANVVVTLLDMVDKDGVLHVTLTHAFDFADGNAFTTQDTGVAEPINEFGLHNLNETLTIVSGTGEFEGASGILHVHGQLDFGASPPEAIYEVHGVISR